MRIKYIMSLKNGELGRAAVRFDNNGQGYIEEANSDEIKRPILEALKTPLKTKRGEVRYGALVTAHILAQPGTPEHAMAMINHSILLEKGIQVESVEGEPFEI